MWIGNDLNLNLDTRIARMLPSPCCLFLMTIFSVCFRPNSFSWDQVVRLSPVERLDHAFTVAKDQLAIERLLDPEGNLAPCFLILEFFFKKRNPTCII